jgi:hypothetical protein
MPHGQGTGHAKRAASARYRAQGSSQHPACADGEKIKDEFIALEEARFPPSVILCTCVSEGRRYSRYAELYLHARKLRSVVFIRECAGNALRFAAVRIRCGGGWKLSRLFWIMGECFFVPEEVVMSS